MNRKILNFVRKILKFIWKIPNNNQIIWFWEFTIWLGNAIINMKNVMGCRIDSSSNYTNDSLLNDKQKSKDCDAHLVSFHEGSLP